MKRAALLLSASLAVILIVIAPAAKGEEYPQLPPAAKPRHWVKPLENLAGLEALKQDATSASTVHLPVWVYRITASKDGKTHSGYMVGTSPAASTTTTTNVATYIVPLRIHIGTATFDPTVSDPCIPPGSNTDGSIALTLFQHSPLFNAPPAAFIMNGANVGATQYTDAFQRANFWFLVSGKPYHTLLSPIVTLAPFDVTVPAASGAIYSSPCGHLGVMDINWFDGFVTSTILPSYGVINPANFPILLLNNVVMSQGSPTNSNNCCILGYHSLTPSTPAGSFQTYSAMDFDDTAAFSGVADTDVAAHEIGEWMDDPYTINFTPAWGGIGQVGGCQSNLEVGDPLQNSIPPVTMPNQFNYHLQELAFFSWFFNSQSAPSAGSGGKFSDNGTFVGPSKVCPPGGTF